MDITGGGKRVRVTHPVLQLTNALGLRNSERPEGVPEVVETNRLELRALLGGAVASAKSASVKVAAFDADEDEVVRASEPVALQYPSECLSYVLDQGDGSAPSALRRIDASAMSTLPTAQVRLETASELQAIAFRDSDSRSV
jgi:hypothetical protein